MDMDMNDQDKPYLSWAANLKPGVKPHDRRVVGIDKLHDAKKAGGKKSHMCTLIITEGDSAKLLVKSALSVLSPEAHQYYGVYPLNGKPLNVRRATHKKISTNVQFNKLKTILGLQHGSLKALRYGRVMIMADQDPDGSHIKGLLINYFHYCWPKLLKRKPSFLVVFITPIVKAIHKQSEEIEIFYSMHDYNKWNEKNDASNWTTKYYKGLGSISSDEAKQYFRNFKDHVKLLVSKDAKKDKKAIELAFSKKQQDVEDRRAKLLKPEPHTKVDWEKPEFTISEFVNHELFLYFETNLRRSIPRINDGLKLCQRKILFTALKRNLINDTKVSLLANYTVEDTAYHHGTESLTDAIILMAHDFPGSNNINLFQMSGQFGTRDKGGNDAPETRYIDIKLSPITRLLFPAEEDDVLLKYLKEDEKFIIEPEWFAAIVPIILINGCRGIATGWSSVIPNYNPSVIIENLNLLMDGETTLKPMIPWYRKFNGKIKKTDNSDTYISTGVHEIVGDTTIVITELPIGSWTQNYKKYLQKDKPVGIQDIEDLSDESHVMLILKMPKKDGSEREKSKNFLDKGMFKLSSNISTKNMYLYDEYNKLKKYDSPEQLIREYYKWRLSIYAKRLKHTREIVKERLREVQTKIDSIHVEPESEDNHGKRKRSKVSAVGHSKRTLLDELKLERAKLQKILKPLKKETSKSLWRKDLKPLKEKIDNIEKFDKEAATEWEKKSTEVTERINQKAEQEKDSEKKRINRTAKQKKDGKKKRNEKIEAQKPAEGEKQTQEKEKSEEEKQVQEEEKQEEKSEEESRAENKEGKGEEKQGEDDEE